MRHVLSGVVACIACSATSPYSPGADVHLLVVLHAGVVPRPAVVVRGARHRARTLAGLKERVPSHFCLLAAAITLNHRPARNSRAVINYCA